MYGCFVSYIDGNAITYDSASGEHEAGKTISDVKHLGIRHSTFDLMPQRLDRLFNLTSLLIQWSNLTKLVDNDFIGLENLEYLHLGNNLLRNLSGDVFWRLSNLKTLTLRDNLIFELPKDIFEYNLKLEGIYLANNQIKYINPTIFDDLPKLYYAEFLGENHKCSTKYYSGLEEIATLKQDVKKCANPNELTTKEIFGVMEQCDIDTDSFIKFVKENRVAVSEASTSDSVNTSPAPLITENKSKEKCMKLAVHFASIIF